MAYVAPIQCISSASSFIGQPRLASLFVRLKVIPQPRPRLHTRVIRSAVEDWSPKELHHFTKKEAQKKLRKIRKERKANARAKELAQNPVVKANPAILRFERPLRNWNKPWRKKKVSVLKSQIGDPQQCVGFKQGNVSVGYPKVNTFSSRMESDIEQAKSFWRNFDAIYEEKMRKRGDGFEDSGDIFQNSDVETSAAMQPLNIDIASNARSVEREDSDKTPQQSSKIGAGNLSRSAAYVDDKHSVWTRTRQVDTVASKFGDDRETLGVDGFTTELSRSKLESSTESTSLVNDEKIAGNFSAREVPRILIGQRKGKDVYLSIGDDDATVKKELPRSDLDEDKQLEWLAKQLNSVARPDGVHFSRVMRSGGLKITNERSIVLVRKLGDVGNWRCALQVVEWLDSRHQFPAIRTRYLYTALLVVLRKARRPIESLNVFKAMTDDVACYPDMPAYRNIAVTLGQTGYLEELLELMQTLRRGPDNNRVYQRMVNQGRLYPDIVVYNAALNACVTHRHWRLALWILDKMYEERDVVPNSASYGLAIEVMVKAGKFGLAWKIFDKMELGSFHPNSLTYKAVVEGLGHVGKADLAIQIVKRMEEGGIVADSGVYYALACTLCICGRWQDALLQVDRIATLPGRPLAETYTGLIKACKDYGRWRDAISVFEHMRQVCAPNIGTYNVMISVYSANSMYSEAKNIFLQIKQGRLSPRKLYRADLPLSPDVFTYDAMLGACTRSKKWEDLEVIFRQMLLQGHALDCKRHSWILQAVSEAGKDHLVAAMFSHIRSSSAATPELYVLMIKTCLSEGEQDKAFSYLEEMVTEKMRIRRSDFQIFQSVACLLSAEDRTNFTNKVESLNSVKSDFNFTGDSRFSSSRQRSYTFKQPRLRHSLFVRYGMIGGMRGKQSKQKSLQDLSSSLARGSLQKKPFSEAISPLDLVVTQNLASEEPEELVRLASQLDESNSMLRSAGVPGWEFLWKRSTHTELSPSKFHRAEQLT